MMTNGDREGQIFLSHPHVNNSFLVAHHLEPHFRLEKNMKTFSRNPEFAEMRHGDVILTLRPTYSCSF